MFPLEKKELVHSAMVTDMPAEGDMSIFYIANAFSNHDRSLERVSGKYNWKHRMGYVGCILVVFARNHDTTNFPMGVIGCVCVLVAFARIH